MSYGSTAYQAPMQMGMAATPGVTNDPFGGKFRVQQLLTKREIFEACCGCECGNRYLVRPEQPGMTTLAVDEDSTFLQKLCCGAQRGLTFNVHYGDQQAPTILQMHKPFGFGGHRNIGYVQDHCACCGVHEEIFNSRDQHLYTVTGSCVQCGACCPCGDARYDVVEAKSGRNVGAVVKTSRGCGQCLQEAFADVQGFDVTAPGNAGADEKALLMATALMIDLQYYEREQDKNGGGNQW
eukprot:g16930.t1